MNEMEPKAGDDRPGDDGLIEDLRRIFG